MTWRTRIELAFGVLAAGLIWYFSTPKPAPVNEWTQAKTVPQVVDVPKVSIQPKQIIVYSTPVKKHLGLPTEARANNDIVVVAASRVPSDLHPQTVTTLLDQNTGEFQTLVRREPYSWLAAEQSGELRVDYGIKNGMVRIGRLSLHEDLMQLSALHLGVSAALDTDRQFFAGAGVEWKW